MSGRPPRKKWAAGASSGDKGKLRLRTQNVLLF